MNLIFQKCPVLKSNRIDIGDCWKILSRTNHSGIKILWCSSLFECLFVITMPTYNISLIFSLSSLKSPRQCWAVTSRLTTSTLWQGPVTRKPPSTKSSTEWHYFTPSIKKKRTLLSLHHSPPMPPSLQPHPFTVLDVLDKPLGMGSSVWIAHAKWNSQLFTIERNTQK